MTAARSPLLVGDLLGDAARRFPETAALIIGSQTLSFAALERAANRFAHALAAAGAGKGAIAAIIARNVAEYAIAYFGAARAGAILAHLSTRYGRDEIANVLARLNPALVLAEPALAPLLAGASPAPRLLAIGPAPGPSWTAWDAFLARQPETPPAVAIDADDPYMISLTGGTTGWPKGAVSSHRARVVSAWIGIEDLRLAADEVLIVGSPLYHAAGLITLFQSGIAAGCTTVLMPAWSPAGFIAEIARTRATTTLLVPAQVSLLIDDPAFARAPLASLRKLVYGGAPMPPELLARAEAALPDVAFVQNYGQTETGPLITIWPEERRARPASIGRAGRHIEVAVFQSPGEPARPGEAGEIATRGPHLMSRYHDDEAETAAFFKAGDGWGYTGDVGTMDAAGYLTLIDRAKDVIISGGVNVYPAEIERELGRHPAVKECAAFGLADARWGEIVAAEVVLAEGARAAADEIIGFCAERIAAHKRPRRIFVVEALPRTAGGKVQKSAIRARHRQA